MGELISYPYATSLRTAWPRTAAFDPSLSPQPFDAMEIVARDSDDNPTIIDYYTFSPLYTGSYNFTGSYSTFTGSAVFTKVQTSYMAYSSSLLTTMYTVKRVGDPLNDSAVQ